MEPFEIFGVVNEALAVASHAIKTAKAISEAFKKVKEVREDVTRAANTVELIETTLDALQRELQKRPWQYSWEQRHHKAILNVLMDCRDDLDCLQQGLTKDSERLDRSNRKSRGKIQTFVRSIPVALDRYMREDEQILDRLHRILAALQGSIVTVSAPITWNTPLYHEDTLKAIQSLPMAINRYARADRLFRDSPLFLEDETDVDTFKDESIGDSEKNTKNTRNIKNWTVSAFELTENVVTKSMDRRVSSMIPAEPDATAAVEAFDASGNSLARPKGEDLWWQYKNARVKVDQLESLSLHFHAAIYQRKSIHFREDLQSGYGHPFPPKDRAEMNEKLIEVLLSCNIPDCTQEALKILEQVAQSLEDVSTDCKLRSLHRIGIVCLRPDINDALKAFQFLSLALTGYLESEPRDVGKVNEVFELYSKAGHMSDMTFEVSSTEMRLEAEMKGDFRPLRQLPALALQWCQQNGFEVHRNQPLVPFDHLRDSKKNTPFHVAARDRKISEGVFRELLSGKESLEALDSNNDSALFIAIDNSHSLAVRLLLDFGANVHFQHPKKNQTVLHRLQRCRDDEIIEAVFNKLTRRSSVVSFRDSMIGPTEVPTDDSSDANRRATISIDTCDWYQKTAIQEASKQGNITLVSRLIKAGADPDLPDVYGRTPLLEACSNPIDPIDRREIIGVLVRAGANPKHKDENNVDAEKELKKKSNFKKSEIAALLSDKMETTRNYSLSSGRSRRTSSATTGTTLESLEPVRTPSLSPGSSLPPVLKLPTHHQNNSEFRWPPELYEKKRASEPVSPCSSKKNHLYK